MTSMKTEMTAARAARFFFALRASSVLFYKLGFLFNTCCYVRYNNTVGADQHRPPWGSWRLVAPPCALLLEMTSIHLGAVNSLCDTVCRR